MRVSSQGCPSRCGVPNKFSVLTIVIGPFFAAQNTLGNLVAGLSLLLLSAFRGETDHLGGHFRSAAREVPALTAEAARTR